MKNSTFTPKLRKIVLSSALAVLIPASNALADQYVWGSLTGSTADPATCAASANAAGVTFTMINPSGSVTANSDAGTAPGAGDILGQQTQTCGSVTFDTVTQTGSAEIVAFLFAGGGTAAAQSISIDLLQSPQDLSIGNLFLANMLFNWNGNNGIPVSLVWDATGLLNEMDGTPTSFTLNADGSVATNADYSQGSIPATDGINLLMDIIPAVTFADLATGPSPLAMRVEDTPNITINADECKLGFDGDFSNNVGGGCMAVTPSADKTLNLLADIAPAPDGDLGWGGNPMQDGPFAGSNANFDFHTVKLVQFVDTTAPVITWDNNTPIQLTVGDVYVDAGVTNCIDAAPLNTTLTGSVVTGGTYPGNTNTGGTYTITYSCSDTALDINSNPAPNNHTVTRTININTPPVANSNFDQTVASDGSLVIDFALGDLTGGELIGTDAESDAMTITAGTTANGGVITNNGTNAITYTPAAGYNGPDSFSYVLNDGLDDSASGTVNITVTNVLPVANDDTAGVFPSNFVIIDVLGNDTDHEDGSTPGSLSEPTVTVGGIVQGTEGVAVANGDGTITYTAGAPASDPATDTFTYTVTDSDTGVSVPATVTVTISSVGNTPPVNYNSDFNTDAGTTIDINIDSSVADTTGGPGGVVADDAETHPLTFVGFGTPVTTTGGGSVVATDGTNKVLQYTPLAGFNGVDTFTFSVNDGITNSASSSTMTINVNQVVPVATDKPVSMLLQEVTLNIDLTGNVSDVEDDTNGTALVTVTPATPSNGTAVAVVAADGTIDYTPTSVGVHTFDYTVTDSDSNVSTPATVTVTVTAAPVTASTLLNTDEDVAITTITVASVATDDDGDTLTFATFDATSTQGGAVTINGANDTLTYTPATDFNGTDTFTFSVTDTVNTSSGTSTITVDVAAIDDLMACQGSNYTTTVDNSIVITTADLIGLCSDIDGPVTLVSNTQTTNGTLVDDGAGNLTYTPTTSYVGPDSFTFTASDSAGGDQTYTATIAVVDDPSIHIITGANFTMIDGGGNSIGGATDVNGVFDEKLICNAETCTDFAMTTPLASQQAFESNIWTAHHIRVFGPGSYSFDSACSGADIAAGTTNCGGGAALVLEVGAGQLGAHMLFDWGTNSDIDVAVLWDYNQSFGTLIYDGGCLTNAPECDSTHSATRAWNWVSIDGNNNGNRGIPMVDGPFGGFHANFNLDMEAGYTPPVANNDGTSTTVSLLVTIDLLANDADAEDGAPPTGATVTLDTATMLVGSTLVNNNDGTVDYTPDASLVLGDTDTFNYTITDVGGAVSNSATVTVTISNNTAPTANNVTFVSDEDTVLTISTSDLDSLGTAVGTDGENDPLTFATFDSVSAELGAVTVDGTGSILSYTPAENFNGTDTLTFSVNDGIADSAVATITITVNPVNDAVVCTGMTVATGVDEVLTLTTASLIAGSSCTDVDNDTISYASAAQPANPASSLVDDNAGTLTYTPEAGLSGADSFVITATDGNGGDGTANIKVQVGQVFGNFTMLNQEGNVFGGTNDVVFEWDNTELTSESDTVFNMTIVSDGPELFFSALWFAHHVRVFGPGTYSFEANNALCESKGASPDTTSNGSTKTTNASADDIEVTGCPGTGTATTINLTVAEGQIGVHMLFDYNGSFDIDVVNLYDLNAVWEDANGQGDPAGFNDLWSGDAGVAPAPDTEWVMVSRDVNGDGINGSPMVDGPFIGFSANFSDGPGGTAPPPEDITTGAQDTRLGNGGMFNWALLLGMLPLLILLRRRNK